MQILGKVSKKASDQRLCCSLASLSMHLMPTLSCCAGKRWLDLGAGCGLLSMLLSYLGADYVLATDILEVGVDFLFFEKASVDQQLTVCPLKFLEVKKRLETNINRNMADESRQVKINSAVLEWGNYDKADFEKELPFDGIIAGDVLYKVLFVQLSCFDFIHFPHFWFLLAFS